VPSAIDAAWEQVVVQTPTSELKPSEQARSRRLEEFELDWLPRLLLHDDCAMSNLTIRHHVAEQLAVDGQVEQRPVAQAALMLEKERDGPDVSALERFLGANHSTIVPGRRAAKAGSYWVCAMIVLLRPIWPHRRSEVWNACYMAERTVLPIFAWTLLLGSGGDRPWSTDLANANPRTLDQFSNGRMAVPIPRISCAWAYRSGW